MSLWKKGLLLQLWFFIGFPLLGAALVAVLGPLGALIQLVLFVLWCWEIFAFMHYRYCRQEEFLNVLQTAAVTQAPVESVLRAYLRDRPREHLYRAILLFFVFPGYYWIHVQRSFDRRVSRLLAMLDSGLPLDQALHFVPGVVSNDIALAVTAGNYNGKLTNALKRLPDRRSAPQWLELALRLLYPFLLLASLINIVAFLMIFIVPKLERIVLHFNMKLPASTEFLVAVSRWSGTSGGGSLILWLLLLIVINALVFSSRAKWSTPVVSWVYRLSARGQFLRLLGLMLETGRPVPEILERMLITKLLPSVIAVRVKRLAASIAQGQSLAESLARHGLITAPMQGLIASAEKAQNLPWALQELGDSLVRRSSQVFHRLTMVLFPLIIFAIACLVGFVAVAMLSPLITIIEGMHG